MIHTWTTPEPRAYATPEEAARGLERLLDDLADTRGHALRPWRTCGEGLRPMTPPASRWRLRPFPPSALNCPIVPATRPAWARP